MKTLVGNTFREKQRFKSINLHVTENRRIYSHIQYLIDPNLHLRKTFTTTTTIQMLFIIPNRPFLGDKREEKGENVDVIQPADGIS